MKRRLLLILAAVQRPGNEHYRLIKYSEFPPLSLLTIAGLTPDGWEITVRDEHVESSEVEGDVDLVGIQTYISSASRAYELAQRWRARCEGRARRTPPDEHAGRGGSTRRCGVRRSGRDGLGSDSRRLRTRAAAAVLSGAL